MRWSGRQGRGGRGDGEVEQQLLALRVILAALMGGVALFAGVVFAYHTWMSSGELAMDGAATFGSSTVLAAVFAGALAVQLLVAPLVSRAVRDRTGGLDGLRTGTILAGALKEGMGFLGLVFCFIGARPLWALAFGAVTVATMALDWPRREDAERAAR